MRVVLGLTLNGEPAATVVGRANSVQLRLAKTVTHTRALSLSHSLTHKHTH